MIKKLAFSFLLFTLLFFTGLFWAASVLSKPAYSKNIVPKDLDTFEVVTNKNVKGWYVQSIEHKACILLMHGVRSNRTEMIGRANFLKKAGYSSFSIDLQAHGENEGEQITFGVLESESAAFASKFLYENKSCPKVVALGSSLGGAASLLGQSPLNVDGYILEGVYSSIEKAVENRLSMRIGSIGKTIAPLLYYQIPLRLGVDLEALRPAEAIKNIKSPVLIMNGENDRRTTVKEARLLFDNAPTKKHFHKVIGAKHTNLHNHDRESYEKVVLAFLSKYIDEGA